ncbi:MAG: RHS repeat-associated core domain-containing protein, partial [Bacteroidales bacterium]|nr:RHS repeat-associated core domain-containing protein [Bacteroidales bacterium]
ANNVGNSQTPFAPTMQNGDEDVFFTFGINGSLRKREVQTPNPYNEYFLFNSQNNLKAYSDDVMSFAYYGYNAANTRTYKISLYNTNLWINGQQQPLHLQWQNAMFYPNTYLNFNQNGEYTKHYYNGMERVASRLGDNNTTIAIDNMLENRKLSLEERVRNEIQELIAEPTQVDMPPVLDILNLQPTGTPNDIYYYHPNHLGSTSFVTDQNQTITQGFLYAPFGEITTEYNINFGNNVIPKYSFNAKELDEETGFYYYEARYYAPPTFTSRDPLFEKYFWMSPYAYCANNPIKYVDPSGKDFDPVVDEENKTITIRATYYTSKENEADLQKALDVWNNQSGQYSYVVGKGKDKQTYTINFELTINSFDTQNEAGTAYDHDESGYANFYNGRTYNGIHRGLTSNGRFIQLNINESLIPNPNRTFAHEIAHTLGISEWTQGLMESGGFNEWISKDFIIQIFSTSGFNPKLPCISWDGNTALDMEEHKNLWKSKNFESIPDYLQNGKIKTKWP